MEPGGALAPSDCSPLQTSGFEGQSRFQTGKHHLLLPELFLDYHSSAECWVFELADVSPMKLDTKNCKPLSPN